MNRSLATQAKHPGNSETFAANTGGPAARQSSRQQERTQSSSLPADVWDWYELDDEPLPEHGDFWIEIEDSAT